MIENRIIQLKNQLKNLDGWQYRRCIHKKLQKEIEFYTILKLIDDIKNNNFNDNFNDNYAKLIFVGEFETVKLDDRFVDISFNPNTKYEQLPSDINPGNNLILSNELKNNIQKLNLYFKKYLPLLYNGTPKPGTYFDSNIPLNKKLGQHRLGLVYGKPQNVVKNELEKLNQKGVGILNFFGIGIYHDSFNGGCKNHCKEPFIPLIKKLKNSSYKNQIEDDHSCLSKSLCRG